MRNRIKSRTDVITNSSNETFITKREPKGYDYNDFDVLTWDIILKPDSGSWSDELDLMVHLVESNIGHELQDNPFTIPEPEDNNGRPWWSEPKKPWAYALDCGWTWDERMNLWTVFVKAHESEFKTIVGYCYVSGIYDHDCSDWDIYESANDRLGSISVLRASRDSSFNY